MSITKGNLVCVDDYKKEAEKILPKNALDYYRSGALQQVTLAENSEAINR